MNSISLKTDIKILFMTVRKVLGASDVAQDTRVAEGNFAQIRKEQAEQAK